MSDKRPHIKPEELASLIRRYLTGELEDKNMHTLEKQALDDPFLADALEGYGQAMPDQRANQDDLAARLAARVASAEEEAIVAIVARKGKVRSLYYRIAAVAAILLLMFSAGWYLHQTQKKPVIASRLPLSAPVAVDTVSFHQEDKNALPSLAAVQPKEKAKLVTVPKPVPALSAPAEPEKKITPLLAAKKPVQGVTADTAADDGYDYSFTVVAPEKYSRIEKRSLPALKDSQVITAMLRDETRNRFSYRADSLQVVHMLEGKVAGVNVDKDNVEIDMPYRAPMPAIGEAAYERYLQTKTANPGNQYAGIVRISFTVMPDGKLEDFKVIHHLNEACDAEAIRVVKEGPVWLPASDKKPTKIKVKVKFSAK
ncbi:energy transducer TonB [Chitinophaga sp. 30R24]|uniref:energy transducer TonB n=1 Tax=Chitinophaga sp. 30R24 TaxID=3248838 RepID=UPI003B8FDAE6